MSTQLTFDTIYKGNFLARANPPYEDTDNLLNTGDRFFFLTQNNPIDMGPQQPVQLIALEGKEVLGRINFLAGQAIVRGQRFNVLWYSGLKVSRRHRGKGVATKLVTQSMQLHHTIAGIGFAEISLKIFRKLPFVEFSLPRYILPFRSRSIFQKFLGKNMLAAAASTVADQLLSIHRLWLFSDKGLRCCKRFTLETADLMHPEMDPKLSQLSSPFSFYRSSKWFNWLLQAENPDERKNQALFYIKNSAGFVIAYFILRRRFHEMASQDGYPDLMLGSLKDWGIFEPAEIDLISLVLLAARQLHLWQVDAAEFCIYDPAVESFLKKNGFVQKKALQFMITADASSPLRQAGFNEQSYWRLTASEGDNFFN